MFNPVGVAGHGCAVGHGFHPRLLTLKPFGLSNPDCSGLPVSVQVLHDLSGIAFNPSGGLRLVARGMVLNVQPRRGHRGIIASDLYLSVIYQVLIFSLPTVGMLSIPSVQLCVILQPKFQNITTLLPNSVTIGTSVCLIFASSNINKTI